MAYFLVKFSELLDIQFFFIIQLYSQNTLLLRDPKHALTENVLTTFFSPIGNSRPQPLATGSKLEDLRALLRNSRFFIWKHWCGKVSIGVDFPKCCGWPPEQELGALGSVCTGETNLWPHLGQVEKLTSDLTLDQQEKVGYSREVRAVGRVLFLSQYIC